MAAIIYFHSFTDELVAGTHVAALNGADTDVLKVYLTNTTPSVSTHTVYAAAGGGGLEEIANATGYTVGGEATTNTSSTSSGVIEVVGVDVTWTAAAGDWGTFRYVVLYNATQANKLIGYWDNGSAVDLADTDPFVTDFGATMFKIGGVA